MKGSNTEIEPAVCLGPASPASEELTAQKAWSDVVKDVLYCNFGMLCNVVNLEQVESVAKGGPCHFAPGRQPE